MGYRKGAFVRQVAARIGPLVTCDFAAGPDDRDLARFVSEAFVAGDRRRAGASAADRLGQTPDLAAAHSREVLRREWAACEGSQIVALRDPHGALATPVGADLLAELVSTLPASRALAVMIREPFPPALRHIAASVPSRTLETDELGLTPDEVLELCASAGLPERIARSVYALARGWPLVSGLLVALLRRGEPIEELAEAAETLSGTALFAFATQRLIARLDDRVRDALAVTSIMRGATQAQLVRILGDECDDLIFARLSNLPFVRTDTEAVVHPDVTAIMCDRFAPLVNRMYERTLSALTGDGSYIDAAEVAVRHGDVNRAAAIMDAAPPYTAAPVPLIAYERIIERLDGAELTRFPNLWIATIPYRSFAVDRPTFVREAETVYFCLPPGSSPDQRAAALMVLAFGYISTGRRAEAETLVAEGLEGFAREPSGARASLLNFSAWMRGMDGHFSLARALASEAAAITRVGFAEHQTLHYIEAHEAAYRGHTERAVVVLDELLRRAEDLPIHRANTAANAALFTWTSGDEDAFAHYLDVLEDALTPGLERGLRPILDAGRGRSVPLPDAFAWPIGVAQTQLFRLGNASSVREALDAARTAARYADTRDEPYTRLLAHTALFVLDEDARAGEMRTLEAIVRPVESQEMKDAVRALTCGEPPGMLDAFVRRRVRRERGSETAPVLRIELLAGRVLRDGTPLRVTEKEFELLVLLATSRTPLSRERIGEALWDHLDPEEWPNNLKVTLSRLRGKLGSRDAIVLVDGRYRMAPRVDVDLRRAEALTRGSAGGRLEESTRNELLETVAAIRAGGTERYERLAWGHAIVARIQDVAARAGLLLANDAFTTGRLDEALRHAADVADIDPFNETACEMALRVLIARGEIDEARKTYKRYVSSLSSELGVRPSSRLAVLVHREL